MRAIIPTLAGLVAVAATSVQAAPVPANHHSKWHETPAQNVRQSQYYDYLVVVIFPPFQALAASNTSLELA